MAIVSKKKDAPMEPHHAARQEAEARLRKMKLYLPQPPELPEELNYEEFTDEEGNFAPPASATEFDEVELGAAFSYMNSQAEFVETQLGLLQIELREARIQRQEREDQLLGGVDSTNRNTKVSLEKARARRDPDLLKWTQVVNQLEAEEKLLERFLNAYDRKCSALSRELTRRGYSMERFTRNDNRGRY